MTRTTAALFVAFLTAFAACSDKNPSGPGGDVNDLIPPAGMIVSNPLATSSHLSSIGVNGSVNVSAIPLAYVSALPGTFPGAVSAEIRNQTRGGASQPVKVTDGGFDPVRIEAEVGDVLALTVTITGGGMTTATVKVPARRPPTIVRTNPPKGRTDVALNVQVIIVFSEPVDPTTVTSSSLALLRDGIAPVQGTVAVAADGLSAQFIPASPLEAQTDYVLAANQTIHDLNGDALGESSTFGFTTGVGTVGAIVLTSTTTATAESDLDPDGYSVIVDGNPAQPVGINSTLTIADLFGGMHSITLEGVTGNCTVSGGSKRQVRVASAATTNVAFDVRCEPKLNTQLTGLVAFVSERDGNPEIYVIKPDGTGLVRLTNNAAADTEPAWSPDGKRIAFTSDRDGGEDIYVMNADGSNVVRRTNTGSYNESPAWSPDGRKIAFSSLRNGDLGIYVINVDEDWTKQTHVGFDRGWIAHPSWSPDGSKIAFVSDWRAFDFLFDLYVVNADGSGIAGLVEGPFFWVDGLKFYFQPAWSPAGDKIAVVTCVYARDNCYPKSSVAIANADGSELKTIVDAGGFARPTWSPDGSTIAYSSSVCRTCGASLRYTTADGSKSGLIFPDGHSPSWRPDQR
jgi:hypothetical protein